MKIAVHLPVSVAVAAGMALTGFVGAQIVSPLAPGWQTPAYHVGQYRAVPGAIHSGGYKASAEPANYPGDGSDDYGSADNGGGGGAGG